MNIIECTFCKNDDLIEDNFTITCKDCGLILNNELNISSYVSYEEPQNSKNCNYSTSRLTKMQKWYDWTSEEKQIYKLKSDTRLFCENLKIDEKIINTICEFVSNIMTKIKQTEGSKRSRVKHGIIIMCICYISNNPKYSCNINYNSITLAKKIGLDIKYITKADKILMEIMNCDLDNTLHIDTNIVYKQDKPLDYINLIIEKYNLHYKFKHTDIINKTEKLINICEDNDLLTDHTSMSIGVCCFYYILKLSNIEINTNTFTKMFNVTNITITKIHNKLKQHDIKIKNLLL